jgi:hypothetical protein
MIRRGREITRMKRPWMEKQQKSGFIQRKMNSRNCETGLDIHAGSVTRVLGVIEEENVPRIKKALRARVMNEKLSTSCKSRGLGKRPMIYITRH